VTPTRARRQPVTPAWITRSTRSSPRTDLRLIPGLQAAPGQRVRSGPGAARQSPAALPTPLLGRARLRAAEAALPAPAPAPPALGSRLNRPPAGDQWPSPGDHAKSGWSPP